MVCERKGKIAAWLVSLACIAMLWADPAVYGISASSGFAERLTYPWVHAGFLHCLLNVWVVLCVVFTYNLSIKRMIAAFAIAATLPTVLLSEIPVAGLSGVDYALIGFSFGKSRNRRYFLVVVLSGIAVQYAIPGLAASVHLYCFTLGLAVTLIYAWIRRFGKY